MAEPLVVTAELLERAAGTKAVRAMIEAKARRILPRAQRIAAGAGALEFARQLRVDSGTRPGTKAGGFKRPYARVMARVSEEVKLADQAATLSRRQVLRRAANA